MTKRFKKIVYTSFLLVFLLGYIGTIVPGSVIASLFDLEVYAEGDPMLIDSVSVENEAILDTIGSNEHLTPNWFTTSAYLTDESYSVSNVRWYNGEITIDEETSLADFDAIHGEIEISITNGDEFNFSDEMTQSDFLFNMMEIDDFLYVSPTKVKIYVTIAVENSSSEVEVETITINSATLSYIAGETPQFTAVSAETNLYNVEYEKFTNINTGEFLYSDNNLNVGNLITTFQGGETYSYEIKITPISSTVPLENATTLVMVNNDTYSLVFTGSNANAVYDDSDGSITFYGVPNISIAGETTYTLTFETNGGDPLNALTRPENSVVDLTDPNYIPTKQNYEFEGWYSDVGLQNKITSITLDENKTVYANWTEVQTPVQNYTVTYSLSGLLSSNNTTQITNEQNYTTTLSVDPNLIPGEGVLSYSLPNNIMVQIGEETYDAGDVNYSSQTGTLTIPKSLITGNITIIAPAMALIAKPTASTTTFTYDGGVKELIVTGYYDSLMDRTGTTVATNAGNYSATYSLSDATYMWSDGTSGPVAINWTINKANNTVTITMGDWEYGSTPANPVVTGIQGNAQYTVYYKVKGANDSTYTETKPTNVGEYTVRVVTNETQNYLSASDTDDFEITTTGITQYAKPTASVTSFTYNGSVRELSVTGYDESVMTRTGVTTAVDADSYSVTYTLKDTNTTAWSDGTTDPVVINWIINKAQNTVNVTMADWEYGATPSDPVVTGIQGNVNYTVLYKERGALDSTYEENKPTAVGQYTVKVVTDVTQNYLSASATYDFEITAPAITKYPKPTASTTSFTYDGTLKTLAVTGYNEAGMLMSGDISATNAGDYTVVYTLNPYTAWDDDSTDAVIINWTIEKANNTVTVTMEDWVYGNAAPSPSVTGIKGNAQYTVYYKVRNANDSTYTATVPSEIGEYTIKAVTAETPNYLSAYDTDDFEIIAPANPPVEKPTASVTSFSYDGTEKTLNVTGYNDAFMNVTGNLKGTDVGSYSVIYTLKDTTIYKWEDDTTDPVIINWTITKGQNNLSVTLANWEYGTTPKTPVVTGNYDNAEYLVQYKERGANDDTYISTVPSEIGQYTVKVVVPETEHYLGGIATADFEITEHVSQKYAKPEAGMAKFTYDGTEKMLVVTGYDETVMTRTGDVTATNAGNYSVTYTLKNDSDTWEDDTTDPVTFNWVINKVTISNLKVTLEDWKYGEQPNKPVVTGNYGLPYTVQYKSRVGTSSYTDEVPTEVGSYRVKIEIAASSNNDYAVATGNFDILDNTVYVDLPQLVNKRYIYTGSPITVETIYQQDYVTVTGITYTEIGTYQARFSLKQDNYIWADKTREDKVIEWNIASAAPEVKTSYTYNSTKLTITKDPSVTGYQIKECNSKGGSCKQIYKGTNTTYTHTKRKYNTTYYYKVRSYTTEGGNTTYGPYTDLISIKASLPAPKLKASQNRYQEVKLTWNKVDGAQKYYLYRCNEDGSGCKNIKTLTGTKFYDKTGKEGVTYKYKVRAYRQSKYGKYSSLVEGLRLNDDLTVKVKNTAYLTNTINIKYKEGATKYEVYKSADNRRWTLIKTINVTDSTEITDEGINVKDKKDLKFNKKYYYRVRAHNGVNYTSYTTKNTTTSFVNAVTVTATTDRTDNIKLSWDKSTGAEKYYIYTCDASGNNCTQLATTTSNSYTDKKAKAGKTVYYKVRAYKAKKYSKYSNLAEGLRITETIGE